MKSCRYLRASKTLIRGVSAKEFILSVHQLKETSALLSQLNSGAIWSGYWADVLSVNGNILPPTSHQARYVACCRQKSTSGRRAQHEVGRTNDPTAAKRTRGRQSGRQRRDAESPWSLSLSVGAALKLREPQIILTNPPDTSLALADLASPWTIAPGSHAGLLRRSERFL